MGLALIAAHRQPWAVVGPAIRNTNPVSVVSWVGLAVSAVGEMIGYVAGVGQSKPKLAAFEFHRVRRLEKGQPSRAMSAM